MNGRQAVVIAVDGLRAAALGAYGNTWHETPALDALASRSVVVEWMFGESPELAPFYDAAWGAGELLRQFAQRGVGLTLVTDDGAVAEWAVTAGVVDVWAIEGERNFAAGDISETALAALAAVAAERLQAWSAAPSSPAGRMLWIHGRGFFGPWDAPSALRRGLVDEGDPDPPDFVAPPAGAAVTEADALLGFRAAYAAQAVVLDECVGGMLAALGESAATSETMVVLAGCRGYALGEHGVVGSAGGGLYGELLQIPCLVQTSGMAPAPPRRSQLSVPRDIGATLARWFEHSGHALGGVDLLDVESPLRQFVRAATEEGEQFLRTPAWMLRCAPVAQAPPGGPPAELFVKPDDRWEANDVGSRCPEVLERLLALAMAGPSEGPGEQSLDADLVEPAG